VAPDAARLRSQLQAAAVFALTTVQQRVERERTGVAALVARAQRAAADVDRQRQRLDDLLHRMQRAVLTSESQRRDSLKRCLAQLDALNPQATLDRGYAVVHKDGRVVSSIAAVGAGDALVIKVADGGFPARVDAPGQRRPRSKGVAKRNGAAIASPAVQPVLFP
jgi:exodeoxyribonuclease VII large subunit